ncbi:MAG: tetrahydrofolate dehydrogenase/cyclohydrolase catalytic domain-containing protein, partial [Chloroflexota bacterium]
MTAKILDGRTVASRLWRDLSDRIAELHERTGATPRLAIVRLDARGPSAVYAASVWRAARSVGVDAFEIAPPEGVALSDLAARIGALNRDPSIAGIVVAQPVPSHLEASEVAELIDPAKDVDGATPLNAG